MAENTIRLHSKKMWCDSEWTMIIDLDELVTNAGKKDKDSDGRPYVVYPIPRAKKLLKFIRQHADKDQLDLVTEVIGRNQKLSAYWDSIR